MMQGMRLVVVRWSWLRNIRLAYRTLVENFKHVDETSISGIHTTFFFEISHSSTSVRWKR